MLNKPGMTVSVCDAETCALDEDLGDSVEDQDDSRGTRTANGSMAMSLACNISRTASAHEAQSVGNSASSPTSVRVLPAALALVAVRALHYDCAADSCCAVFQLNLRNDEQAGQLVGYRAAAGTDRRWPESDARFERCADELLFIARRREALQHVFADRDQQAPNWRAALAGPAVMPAVSSAGSGNSARCTLSGLPAGFAQIAPDFFGGEASSGASRRTSA